MENNIDVFVNSYFNAGGLNNANQAVTKFSHTITTVGDVIGKDLNVVIEDTTKKMENLGKQVNRFPMHWLSIMFGAMQVERALNRVMTSSINTYTKIMEASNNYGTAIQQLGAEWDYLKFTIADALNRVLEPLIPSIIKIVDVFADWIDQHPDEFAQALAGSFALFKGLEIAGSLMMFIFGLKLLGTGGAGAAAAGTLGSVATSLATIAKLGGAAFIVNAIIDFFKYEVKGSPEDLLNSIGSLLIGSMLFFPSPYTAIAALAGVGLKIVANAVSGDESSIVKKISDFLVGAFVGKGITQVLGLGGVPGFICALGIGIFFAFTPQEIGGKLLDLVTSPFTDTKKAFEADMDRLNNMLPNKFKLAGTREEDLALNERLAKLGIDANGAKINISGLQDTVGTLSSAFQTNTSTITANDSSLMSLNLAQGLNNASVANLSTTIGSFNVDLGETTASVNNLTNAINAVRQAQDGFNASLQGLRRDARGG